MENTINSLLSSIVAMVGDARGSLFGQEKCMVDREQLLSIVDALQNAIPAEVQQAQAIIESSNEIRSNARKDAAETRKAADKTVQDAEAMAAKMVEETEIVARAKARSKEILDQAESQRAQLISGALAYAERILTEAENCTRDSYDTLNAGLVALQNKARDDKKAALSQIGEAKKALKAAAKNN